MKIEITNYQKIKRINFRQLHKRLENILSLLDISSKNISFLLCDNKFIKKLNKKFFKEDSSTDVISFPFADKFDPNFLGEIIVSVEEASIRAKEYNNSWEEELNLYLIHGILHLLGYDDRKKKQREIMRNKENKILRKVLSKDSK